MSLLVSGQRYSLLQSEIHGRPKLAVSWMKVSSKLMSLSNTSSPPVLIVHIDTHISYLFGVDLDLDDDMTTKPQTGRHDST